MADPKSDLLFGKIALNWRLITRDLLNRALHYQRTQEPGKPLGEILLEKGILTRDKVNEILAYQQRINSIAGGQPSGGGDPHGSWAGRPPAGEPHGSWMGGQPAGDPHGSWMGGQPPGGVDPGSWRGTPGQATAPHQQQGQSYAAGSMTGSGRFGAPPPTAVRTPPPDGDDLIGQTIGGCTVKAKIGQGGMGAIYLAHHESLHKDVVVKILPRESATKQRTVERFFREARAAAKLEHPNIVGVQDVGTTNDGLNFIIMQYIDGKNLEELISAEGRKEPQDAVRMVIQVAQGLKAAHAAGVIHRDIKADNILVTAGGVVKVTDFGLAKDLNSEMKLTADGAMIGTPLYMAPEIGRVKEIDGRVDIYSLGVTFYYLLTGVQPFRGFSALDILSAKAHEKLKPPEEHFPELPDDYRRVVGKMLEKDRDKRYTDIDLMLRDLEALDRGYPIELGEPSIWPPRGGGRRKGGDGGSNTKLIVGLVVGLIVLLLGVGGAVFFMLD